MLLRSDQIAELLNTAEKLGQPAQRLREKLARSPDDDAHHVELVALLAALSVGEAVPEEVEQGAEMPARPDVRCVRPGGRTVMIECMHVGADLPALDQMRRPLFVEFDQRLREALSQHEIRGNSISLSYPHDDSCDRTRLPNRQQFDGVLASPGFAQFVADLKTTADGTALWHVESHGFFIEACGYGAVFAPGACPPDFRAHPVYRGIKNKMPQVAAFAESGIPVVLFCAVTDAVSAVRSMANRGVDSRGACLAAFGVAGEGEMIATRKGIVTHGKIQGSQRIGAVVVLEVSPRNYLPPHREVSIFENRHAADRLREADLDALRQMLVLTHHESPLDAATLCQQIPMRREAMAWNAKPIAERAADRAFADGEDGQQVVQPAGELQRLLAKGHRLDWSEFLLEVWPFGIVRDDRRRRRRG